MRYFRTIFSLALVVALVGSGFYTNSVHADSTFSSTPESGWPTFNDAVSAIVPASDGSVYVGGSFTNAYNAANPSLPTHFGGFNATNGTTTLVASGGNRGDNILVTISDGGTGWYVGGSFSSIGGQTRNNIAHILSDGSVDGSFAPNFDGPVYALALSPDKSKIYAGGGFTQVNGSVRQYGAAVNAADGSLTSFDPGLDDYVLAIAISGDGSTVYLGGYFTTVGYNAEGIIGLGSFDAVTGSYGAFDAGLTLTDNDPDVYALLLSGTTLYVGGYFDGADGGATQRIGLAAIDTGSGLATSFNPIGDSTNVTIYALALHGSTLYFGGTFTAVNDDNVSRSNIAAADIGTSTVSSFAPDVSGEVDAIAVSPDGNTVFVGGQFTQVNQTGVPVNQEYMASFASDTGLVTAFRPSVDNSVRSLLVSDDGTRVYAGGYFENGLGTRFSVGRIVHIKANKTIDESFNPIVSGGSVYALALSSDESILYAGGGFNEVNNGGFTRNKIAAFTTSNGVATSFDPNVGGITNVYALALSPDDGTLYAGGDFTTVGGATTRKKLAAFDTDDASVTAFNPDFNNADRIYSLALTSDGGTLYAGGDISSLKGGGENRRDIVALDTAGAGTVTNFNAQIYSPPETVYAIALSDDDSTVYAGGQFSLDGSHPNISSGLAAFDGVTGDIANDFNPTIDNNEYIYALALNHNDSELYIGGTLTGINGGESVRGNAANFALSDGSVDDFNADTGETGLNDIVRAMAVSTNGTKLYVGGDFDTLFAVFSSGSSDTTAPVVTVIGDNPAYFTIGNPYHEFGATATDDTDGTLSVSINTSGVDMNTAGTYTVTYSATDAALNVGSSTRSVIVNPIAGTVGVGNSISIGGGGGGSTPPPSTGGTTTPADPTAALQAQISLLLKQVADLQAQIAARTGGSSTLFTKNLKLGDIDLEVKLLQIYLNTHGFTVSSSGPGSSGSETIYFGAATKAALIRFQEAHAADILTPHGLTSGTGLFLSLTRAYVNAHP